MAQGSSVKLDDYREVAPRGAVDFLLRIGERLRGRRLVHVSASRYAGPVVETLNRLVPILNDLGVDTSWEVTIGGADFDTVTRSVGRALAGTEQVITEGMLARLRDTCADNARRLGGDRGHHLGRILRSPAHHAGYRRRQTFCESLLK